MRISLNPFQAFKKNHNQTQMQLLLIIHVLAGTVALMSVAFAVSSEKRKEIPCHFRENLFLIAIFSCYLVFAGMPFARNRKGIPSIINWLAVGLMTFSGISMWLLATAYFVNKNPRYITLMVFGFIALILGITDLRSYKNKTATGKIQISRHLTNMMGVTIALITADLVTSVNIQPVWIWWIPPTITVVPVIVP